LKAKQEQIKGRDDVWILYYLNDYERIWKGIRIQ
jgi:hypothetical protein